MYAALPLLQIFDFLDVDGLGSIDLVAIMGAAPDWLDDLDDEVGEKGKSGWALVRQLGTGDKGGCEGMATQGIDLRPWAAEHAGQQPVSPAAGGVCWAVDAQCRLLLSSSHAAASLCLLFVGACGPGGSSAAAAEACAEAQ